MGTDGVSELVRGIAITMVDAGLPPGIMHVGVDQAGRDYVDVLNRTTFEPLARVYSEADYGIVLEVSRTLMRLTASG